MELYYMERQNMEFSEVESIVLKPTS